MTTYKKLKRLNTTNLTEAFLLSFPWFVKHFV